MRNPRTCLLLPALLPVILSLAPAAPAHGQHAPRYSTYTNFKYRYAVDYPVGPLVPQGEPDAGDGQVFLSRRDGAKMTVYAEYNVFNERLPSLYRAATHDLPPGRLVTYARRTHVGFVVSGRSGGRVFYERLMMRGDRILTLLFDYPARKRAFYDPVTAHVARSLQLLPQGPGE